MTKQKSIIFDIPLIRKNINKYPLKNIKYVNKSFYEDFIESRIETQYKLNEMIQKFKKNNINFFVCKVTCDFSINKCLINLNLSNNNIINIPDIFCLLNIRNNLNLSGNKITQLPNMFGNIQIGGSLDLSCNHLIELPESFGNLCIGRNLFLYCNHRLLDQPILFYTFTRKRNGVLVIF